MQRLWAWLCVLALTCFDGASAAKAHGLQSQFRSNHGGHAHARSRTARRGHPKEQEISDEQLVEAVLGGNVPEEELQQVLLKNSTKEEKVKEADKPKEKTVKEEDKPVLVPPSVPDGYSPAPASAWEGPAPGPAPAASPMASPVASPEAASPMAAPAPMAALAPMAAEPAEAKALEKEEKKDEKKKTKEASKAEPEQEEQTWWDWFMDLLTGNWWGKPVYHTPATEEDIEDLDKDTFAPIEEADIHMHKRGKGGKHHEHHAEIFEKPPEKPEEPVDDIFAPVPDESLLHTGVKAHRLWWWSWPFPSTDIKSENVSDPELEGSEIDGVRIEALAGNVPMGRA